MHQEEDAFFGGCGGGKDGRWSRSRLVHSAACVWPFAVESRQSSASGPSSHHRSITRALQASKPTQGDWIKQKLSSAGARRVHVSKDVSSTHGIVRCHLSTINDGWCGVRHRCFCKEERNTSCTAPACLRLWVAMDRCIHPQLRPRNSRRLPRSIFNRLGIISRPYCFWVFHAWTGAVSTLHCQPIASLPLQRTGRCRVT